MVFGSRIKHFADRNFVTMNPRTIAQLKVTTTIKIRCAFILRVELDLKGPKQRA